METLSSLKKTDPKYKLLALYNNISSETHPGTFIELVHTLSTKNQYAVAHSSLGDRNGSQKIQKDCSDSQIISPKQSPTPGLRQSNDYSDFEKPIQINEQNTNRKTNNRRKNFNLRFRDKTSNIKRDQSSSSQRRFKEKCKQYSRSNQFSRGCKTCFNCGKCGNLRHE